jgi:hypothetical protein
MMYLIETVTKSSISVTARSSLPGHGGEITAEQAVNRAETSRKPTRTFLSGLSPQPQTR